jgi:hypothetical protein
LALNDITKLIGAEKEKGYLTYNEVNDLIPHDVHSPEDLDDLLTTISTQGIDVLEGQFNALWNLPIPGQIELAPLITLGTGRPINPLVDLDSNRSDASHSPRDRWVWGAILCRLQESR